MSTLRSCACCISGHRGGGSSLASLAGVMCKSRFNVQTATAVAASPHRTAQLESYPAIMAQGLIWPPIYDHPAPIVSDTPLALVRPRVSNTIGPPLRSAPDIGPSINPSPQSSGRPELPSRLQETPLANLSTLESQPVSAPPEACIPVMIPSDPTPVEVPTMLSPTSMDVRSVVNVPGATPTFQQNAVSGKKVKAGFGPPIAPPNTPPITPPGVPPPIQPPSVDPIPPPGAPQPIPPPQTPPIPPGSPEPVPPPTPPPLSPPTTPEIPGVPSPGPDVRPPPTFPDRPRSV